MLPCLNILKYFKITNKDPKKYLSDLFGINVSSEDVEKASSHIKVFSNPSERNPVFNRYLKRHGVELLANHDISRSISKVKKDKKLLYFINTAIYRGINDKTITDCLNTLYFDVEFSALFHEENIMYYRINVMNFSGLKEYQIKNFWLENKLLFDYDGHQSIEYIMSEVGLCPSVKPKVIMNEIAASAMYNYKKKMQSENPDDHKDAMKFANMAIKATAELDNIKFKEIDPEKRINDFRIEFEKVGIDIPTLDEIID